MARRQKDAAFDNDMQRVKMSRESFSQALELFKYILPYKGKFSLAMVAMLISSLLGLVFPYVTGKLVDSAILGKANGWLGDIDHIALLLLLSLGLQAVFSFFQSILFVGVGERALADIRRETYSRLVRLPMTFFSQRRVGELQSRISADLTQIQDTLTGSLSQLLRQLIILCGGLALIATMSLKLTLVMLSAFPGLVILTAFIGRKIRKISRKAQDKLADSNTIVEETLQGIMNVKAFANEGYEINRYDDSISSYITSVLKGAKYRAAFVSFIIFGLFGAIVLVLWTGSHYVREGTLSIGELTSFLLYTTFIGAAMGSFADLYGQLQKAVGATERIREILAEKPEPVEFHRSSTAELDGLRIKGNVEFQNISFSYPTRDEVEVLRNISFSVAPGQRIALVGPSGSGKSTLVSLLLRFYQPNSGKILVDGKDILSYPLTTLRSQTSIVPQDIMLFGGTIMENIAYGKTGASEAEIIEAAKKANAHEFITRFPEGYKTLVGERGIKLSGGQRQRIAIARAILNNPAILILDEATSSLDSESERLVQAALETLMEGRTSFIIAHRLSTVRSADNIVVIKEGQMIESGTHEELIEKPDGMYRMLSALQFDLD